MVDESSPASLQTGIGVTCWMLCSVGMMVFNKLAIQVFPPECTLVAVQMSFSVVLLLIFCWRSIHIGSLKDVGRWSAVIPFYSGMLLTSILALKNAPMTLVVTFRVLSPLLSLAIERLYPNPLSINSSMMCSIVVMVMGTALYACRMPQENWVGAEWVLLNMLLSVGDRLLQRLMLAKDQRPVDISMTGVTLLNNLMGMVPLVVMAWLNGEFSKAPAAFAELNTVGWGWLLASCVVGAGISYCGIWAQSMITATSFLVLVNANKFVIIFLEVSILRVKSMAALQVVGAMVTVLSSVWYGMARSQLEEQARSRTEKASETHPLIAKKV